MKINNQYDREIVEKYRDDEIDENDVIEWAEKLKENQVKAKKPDIDSMDINNNLVSFPDKPVDKLGSVNVNGTMCHPIFGVLNNMLVNGMSPVIFIVGDRRLGKSKTAFYIADMLHRVLNITQGSFNPSQQLLYDELEFLLLSATSRRIVEVCDEAHRYLHWQDQRSKFVRAVSGVLDTMAIHNNVHIFVTPKYKDVASGIRDHVDFMVEMKSRQYAQVTWYQDKYGKKGTRGLDFEYEQFPTWFIPDIPEDRRSDYEQIEHEFKYEDHMNIVKNVAEQKIEEKKDNERATL